LSDEIREYRGTLTALARELSPQSFSRRKLDLFDAQERRVSTARVLRAD
jgi:hypothetical protein